MDITSVDLTDATQMEDLFALLLALHAVDSPDNPPPLRETFLATLRQTDPEVRMERLVATVEGRVVGAAHIGLPDIDNRHLLAFVLQVAPEHRRRGVGRVLFERTLRRAREEPRHTLICQATSAVPDGPPRGDAGCRFLEAMGFTPALAMVLRRVDLSTVDDLAERRLHEGCRPHNAGYECVTWAGLTPDRLAPGVARLLNRMNTDAPRGELDIEATTVDPPRLHAQERVVLDRGVHLIGAAAVHRDTGAVAAVTRIDVRPPGDHGDVWLTIADPEHRGHRLGTVVKIEAHRLVRREFPRLKYVHTGNANVNAHMVAINERLGYLPYEVMTNYQRTLTGEPATGARG
jgi:GNAT superfamily N-acetyltransferase